MDTAVSLNLWPQILAAHRKIVQSLPSPTRASLEGLVASFNVQPKHIFHLIYIVENYDASALSTTHFQRRDPFDHANVVDAFWVGEIVAGFLQSNGDGTLKLTEKGEGMRHQRWQIFNDGLATITLLPDEALAEVNGLLDRVVTETAVSTKPSSDWAFHTRQQRGLKPPVAPLAPLARFVELRMDLGAFRDDAHLAAWREYDVSSHAWDCLTLVWQTGAITFAEFIEQLARRGFAEAETAVAMQNLQNADWLVPVGDGYSITEKGRIVRETAEQKTNEIFYAPWSVLSASELDSLQSHLAALQAA